MTIKQSTVLKFGISALVVLFVGSWALPDVLAAGLGSVGKKGSSSSSSSPLDKEGGVGSPIVVEKSSSIPSGPSSLPSGSSLPSSTPTSIPSESSTSYKTYKPTESVETSTSTEGPTESVGSEATAGSKKKKTTGRGFPPVDNTIVTPSREPDTAMAIRGKPAPPEGSKAGPPTQAGSEALGDDPSKGSGGSLDPVAGLNRLNENLKDLNRALDPTPAHSYWITPTAPSIYKDIGHGAKILGDEGKRGVKNIREEAGRTWENVKDEAGRAGKNIVEEINRAPQNLGDLMQGKNLGGGEKQLRENVKAGLETLKENVDAGIKKIDEGMGWEWENQKKHLGSNIEDAKEGLGGSVTKAREDSVAEAGRAWQNVGDESKRIPGNLDHVPTAEDVSKGIKKIQENAQAGIDRINENLKGFNRDFRTPGMHAITPNMPEIYGEIKQGYKDVEAEANRIPGNIKKAGQDTVKEIERVPGNVQKMLGTDRIRDEVTAPAAKAIESEYKRGLDQVGKFEDKAGAEIGKVLGQGAKQLEQMEDAGRKAGQWLDKTVDKAGRDILKGVKQLEDAGKKLGGKIGKAGKEVGDAVGDALDEAKDKVQDAAQQAQQAGEDAGNSATDAAEEGCNAVAGVFGGSC